MIFYITDDAGRQFRAEVDSEEYGIDDTRITGEKSTTKYISNSVTVTAEVGDYHFHSTGNEDPAEVAEAIFSKVRSMADEWIRADKRL